VLVACEVALRIAGSRLSFDERHRRAIPAISARLHGAPSPRILFLGNSLTRCGVDLRSFSSELEQNGLPPVRCEKVVPDDTVISDWYYAYRSYFSDRGLSPDMVIVSFVGEQLSDQAGFQVRKLASLVSGTPSLASVFENDLHTLEDRASFLFAYASLAVSRQEEVKNRSLTVLIPHYRSQTRRLNSVIRSHKQQKEATEPAGSQPTYQRLQRFVQLLQQGKTQGVFVLMPGEHSESLDPKLVETLQKNGMVFLDLRYLLPQVDGHFPDGYHMDSMAANIYSRTIAGALHERLRVPPR